MVDLDALQSVTPDAEAKTHFVIVDAVGVSEQDKTATKPLDRQPTVPLDKIMGLVAAGAASPDLVSTLAARLARLDRQLTDEQRQQVTQQAGGKDLNTLTTSLLGSLDPDAQAKKAAEVFGLAKDQEPTPEQLDQVQDDTDGGGAEAVPRPEAAGPAPEPQAEPRTGHRRDHAGRASPGGLRRRTPWRKPRRSSRTSRSSSRSTRTNSKPSRSSTADRTGRGCGSGRSKTSPPPSRTRLLGATPERVWQAYEATEPQAVKGKGGRDVVDLIALVRHALDPQEPIVPFSSTVQERYEQWLAEQGQKGVVFTDEQRQWLDAIKDHIAKSLRIEEDDFDDVPFNTIGGLGRVHDLSGSACR